ncbi:MAG: hypothetical protein AB1422_00595 [bacterium]
MQKNSKSKFTKDRFIIDTSALISLGLIEMIEPVLSIAEIVVPKGVIGELEDFTRYEDRLGRIAKKILTYQENFIIEEVRLKENIRYLDPVDNECYNLARDKELPLITDDLKAIKRIGDKILTYYSTFFLITLFLLSLLNYDDVLELIEKLRTERNWRENVIYTETKQEIIKNAPD